MQLRRRNSWGARSRFMGIMNGVRGSSWLICAIPVKADSRNDPGNEPEHVTGARTRAFRAIERKGGFRESTDGLCRETLRGRFAGRERHRPAACAPRRSDVPTARATTAVLAAEALEKAREALRKADAVWNWSRRLLAERRLAGTARIPGTGLDLWDRAGGSKGGQGRRSGCPSRSRATRCCKWGEAISANQRQMKEPADLPRLFHIG